MSYHTWLICLASVVVHGINCGVVFGQDAIDAERNRINALLENSVKAFRFEAKSNAVSKVGSVDTDSNGKESLALKSVSIQKWTNDVRDSQSVGLLTLWVEQGRPVAVLGSYIWNERLMHEFDSLARLPFQVFEYDKLLWEPSEQPVFQAVSKELRVESSSTARMRQMKAIASSISVTMMGWRADNTDRESLRLLPRELYRYQPVDKKCVDGALFAFVLGTDPEAILALEAIERDGQFKWQYAFIRQTSAGLVATQNGVLIWEVTGHPSRDDRTGLGLTCTREIAIGDAANPIK